MKRLVLRYWLVISLLISVVLLVVGTFDMWFAYRSDLDRMRALQGAESRIAGVQIEDTLRATERYIREVAGLPWSAGIFSDDDRVIEFQRLLKLVPALFEIRSLDRAGRERIFVSHADLNRKDSGRDWSGSDAFRRAQSQAVGYGAVYFREDSAPFVSLAVREGTEGGGVTIAELDLGFVADAVKAIDVGRSGNAYVVDGSNRLIAHANTSLVLRKTDLSGLPQVQAARAAFADDSPQVLPAMWGVSPDGGADVLSAAYFVPGANWVVFVEQPSSQALDAVRTTIYRALIVLAGGLLLALIGSQFLARSLTRPILSVQEGAAKIGGGDLTTRLDVKTGDEIEALANEFNRMAAQLADYTAGLERKVTERTAQLELANQHKRQFLGNMSHELRTPLNAIIGFSEALKERMFGDLNPKQDEYVSDIHASGLHLLALINDILDLTKVEAGRMELDLAPFAIEPLLASVLTLVRERAQRGRLTLALDVPPDVGPLVADERKVKQIVLNLVTNAVKFTKPGGTVAVSVTQDAAGTTFAITDTGIGIAAEDLERIFAEFHQIRASGEIRFEGTGLGLALTKGLVLLHGGRIDVTSEPAKGSTFTVWLPARAESED